jgi:hypothetical protein
MPVGDPFSRAGALILADTENAEAASASAAVQTLDLEVVRPARLHRRVRERLRQVAGAVLT